MVFSTFKNYNLRTILTVQGGIMIRLERFCFRFALIFTLGKMVTDKLLYVFLRVEDLVVNSYEGQFASRAVALQRRFAYVEHLAQVLIIQSRSPLSTLCRPLIISINLSSRSNRLIISLARVARCSFSIYISIYSFFIFCCKVDGFEKIKLTRFNQVG